MNNIKMLCYDRTNVSGGTDQTSEPKESDISYNWYFLNKGYKC